MSATNEESSETVSKVQRVRLAASSLGISERTVYRRLRSGKLEQLPAEIQEAVSVMTDVSDAALAEQVFSQIMPSITQLACQIDMTNDKLSAMREDVANRDAQIQSLLENQKELTLTIQKLQSQIFELARLALIQPAKIEEKPPAAPAVVEPPALKRRGGLMGWLRTLGSRREGG